MKFRFNPPKLRLYQQIIMCFILTVLIPLGGVSFIIYSINQTALKKELAQFTEHTAEAVYEGLDTEISWQRDQVHILGAYLLDTYQRTHDFSQAAKQVFSLSNDYDAVGIYDANGKALSTTYRNYAHLSPELRLPETLTGPLPNQISFRVLYAETANSQENPYSLRAIVPINRSPVAYYMVQKKFAYLSSLMESKRRTLSDAFFIIDDTGMIIAGPSSTVAGKQHISEEDYRFFKTLPPGVAQKLQTTSQTVSSPTTPASKKVSADDSDEAPPLEKVFLKMPEIQWGIVIESPYQVRQRFVKRARTQSLLLIIACLIGVVLLALFYILGINRNFRQLLKATKAMAEGNYSRRIRLITNSSTPYEIIYLAGEFNRMGRKMADAWQRSQTLNQELTHKSMQEAFLNRVIKALHGPLSLEEIGILTSHSMNSYLNTAFCAVLLKEPDQKGQRLWIWQNGQYPEIGESQLFSFSALEAFLKNPHAQQRVNTEEDPWLKAFHLGSGLFQEIPYQDSRLGWLLLIQDPTTPEIPVEEAELVSLIANQVGVAVHQAHQWQTIQEANQKLAKLDELKSNLIDTVSHELRTPLTSIKGYTSRLLRYEDSLDVETRMKSLKVVKQQADRLSRLVEDLLVIPELEESTLRFFPDRVELVELIDRSVQFIQEKEQRDIQVSAPDTANLVVLTDPDRLEQILLNLLDNAVKYSYPGSPLQVHVSQQSSASLEITVANACDPISPEILSTLFEKFKRLDERLTRTTRGSGLGLFITKGLVEAMGGTITLAYKAGQFQVTFTVPVYQEAVSAAN